MNIEKLIINYLSAQLHVPVYGDVPNLGTEAEFVTVEKVGSSERDHVCKSSLAVQSWSTSRAKAAELNETAKSAMRSAVLLQYLAGAPNTAKAFCVCPLGNEYPVASARALSTIVKFGSLTQGRGMRNHSFRNWFIIVPAKPTVIM